jgi:hypothetical protein
MHVDKRRLIGDLAVAVGCRQDERLHEQKDRLHPWHGQQAIEKARFRTAGVGECILYPLRDQLMHHQFTARTYNLFLCHTLSPHLR